MKNKIIKILTVSVMLSLTVALCACAKTQEAGGTTEGTQNVSDTTSTTAAPPSTETTTKPTTSAKVTTTKATTTQGTTKFSGRFTVNEALDALYIYYGDGYQINGTVSEGDDYYFAVYNNKNDKYASVKVNLKTGNATETIVASGEKNTLNLFV